MLLGLVGRGLLRYDEAVRLGGLRYGLCFVALREMESVDCEFGRLGLIGGCRLVVGDGGRLCLFMLVGLAR